MSSWEEKSHPVAMGLFTLFHYRSYGKAIVPVHLIHIEAIGTDKTKSIREISVAIPQRGRVVKTMAAVLRDRVVAIVRIR